jgi:hypothetical protein
MRYAAMSVKAQTIKNSMNNAKRLKNSRLRIDVSRSANVTKLYLTPKL